MDFNMSRRAKGFITRCFICTGKCVRPLEFVSISFFGFNFISNVPLAFNVLKNHD